VVKFVSFRGIRGQRKKKPRIHENYIYHVGHILRSISFYLFSLFPADRANLRRLFSGSDTSPPAGGMFSYEPRSISYKPKKCQFVDTLFPLAPAISLPQTCRIFSIPGLLANLILYR
jgi:hypothetical protein